MGLTNGQKAGSVRVNLGYVVLDQDDAAVIYDVLTGLLEQEMCFARGIGTDCDEFYDIACEHCLIEKAIDVLKKGGLNNDRLTSIEKDKASIT